MGMAKAAVLPVPVCALPKTSFLSSIIGIDFSCMEVGSL